jgi:hypothetical protein
MRETKAHVCSSIGNKLLFIFFFCFDGCQRQALASE